MMQGEVQLRPPNSQKLNDSSPLSANLTNSSSSSSSASNCDEIKTVDLEKDTSSSPSCRICLDEESELENDELISPCMCKGTQQFVHRSCLNHWRSINIGFGFSHCTTCKAQFHLRVQTFDDDDNNCWRLKAKFRLFVARHVVLVFFLVQIVIAAMAGVAYMRDKDGKFRNSFNGDWDIILSKHPIPFYYCIGAVYFFVLTGILEIILHCGSDERMSGCPNYCYYWPSSMETFFLYVSLFVCIVLFLGSAYVILAATMAISRIWQIHYQMILAKRELTKTYIVEDLHGNYTPPKLDAVQA